MEGQLDKVVQVSWANIPNTEWGHNTVDMKIKGVHGNRKRG